MAKKFKLNQKAFQEIRQLPSVRADLLRRAKNVAAAAGGESKGYLVTELSLEDPRGAVSVMATGHAKNENRKRHTLIRAIDAGRD